MTFINGFENHSRYLLHQLVVDSRDSQRTLLSVLLGNVHSLGRLGRIALIFQALNEFSNAVDSHSVNGKTICTGSHVAGFGFNPFVGKHEHFLVKENTVDTLILIV